MSIIKLSNNCTVELLHLNGGGKRKRKIVTGNRMLLEKQTSTPEPFPREPTFHYLFKISSHAPKTNINGKSKRPHLNIDSWTPKQAAKFSHVILTGDMSFLEQCKAFGE